MTMPIEQSRRESKSELLAVLAANGVEEGRKADTFRCPLHEDKNPSATVHKRTSGVWAFHCFPCDIDEDVYGMEDRLGVARKSVSSPVAALSGAQAAQGSDKGVKTDSSSVEVIPTPARPKVSRTFANIAQATAALGAIQAYTYTHPDTGKPELCVMRLEDPEKGKRFLQLRPSESDGYELGGLKQNPIYNRIRLRNAPLVIVVEGEKCVHALAALQIVATTSPGGSAAAGKADWSPLAGKVVVLWRDHDAPGEKYMREVFEILKAIDPPPAEINWMPVEAMELPEKGDVVDYLEIIGGDNDRKRKAVALAIDEAYPVGGLLDEYKTHLFSIQSGKWSAVEWPFYMLGSATKALYPETQTMLCGEGGTSKSLLVRQAINFWIERGIEVADFELEDDKNFHLKRAHAQLAQQSGITNDAWMRGNQAEYARLFTECEPMLKQVSKTITAAPPKALTLGDMLAWTIKQAKAGKRLIIIDPITACVQGKESWNDDLSFILESREALRKYGASMIVVTHPRKLPRGAMPSLADLAGGQAWPRFTQTVLWIAAMAQAETYVCASSGGTSKEECNRVVKILKARNSWGTGCEIGLYFHGKSLLFEEHGVINKEKGKRR